MSDLISREEVLNLIDIAFESGAFDGRYAYENLIDAVQNLIHPLETDLISRQAAEGKRTEERTETHACDCISRETHASDCISRQAVIDRINRLIEVEKKQGTDDWGYGRERVNAYEAMLHMVESEYLYPSVEPERKPGKWVEGEKTPGYIKWNCSKCGLLVRNSQKPWYEYCPKCGADMRDVPETND